METDLRQEAEEDEAGWVDRMLRGPEGIVFAAIVGFPRLTGPVSLVTRKSVPSAEQT